MIISNESMDFNNPKELDDPQLFDDTSYFMIPSYLMIPSYSIGSMDFDNPKVYGDTSIADGLVFVIEIGFHFFKCVFLKQISSPFQIATHNISIRNHNCPKTQSAFVVMIICCLP